jgi:hypothetical protein
VRKLLAISLLCIHLFNIGGALALRQYFVYKTDRFFDAQIDKNLYSVDDLTEIRIPVDMPGITDWARFENLSGQVQFQYSSYNYVKIRITRHAIYLVCIPNYETTHLNTQNIIYAKQIPDIPVSKKEHVPVVKVNLAVYNCPLQYFVFEIPAIISPPSIFCHHSAVLKLFISGPGQPPDYSTSVS